MFGRTKITLCLRDAIYSVTICTILKLFADLMKINTIQYFFLLLIIFVYACDHGAGHINEVIKAVDSEQLLDDIEFLSSDELEGRFPESDGSILAQEYIINRFHALNLSGFQENFRHPFSTTNSRTGQTFESAVNLIGYTEGSSHPDRFIAVIAHYDHLGIRNGEIYNGADDNASGTAALLAVSRYFSENRPENSILFIALDAEEQGLQGAYEFVNNPPVPLEQIILNINMDMISVNYNNELYAVGTYHYPFLKPLIETAATGAPVNVLFGYDSADWPQDWTMSSDHGPFHEKGIPFVYFGVEDHEHYHQPTDTFENINPVFYVDAVETITGVIRYLDHHLDVISDASER
jgi:Zn-dependent M28 family amino/carboxypeptidase